MGTGSSLGVPIVGCGCLVCKSNDPKDKRGRSSSLITVEGGNYVVDAGPDFRLQALSLSLQHIKGWILTHTHFDHIAGIEDLKVFAWQKQPIPCLLSEESFQEVRWKFSHLFSKEGVSPFFSWDLLAALQGSIVWQDLPLTYVSFFQNGMRVLGFRIGDLAYISDMQEYEESIIPPLQGVQTLVVSAPRPQRSSMHWGWEDAIAFSRKLGAEYTYFTHLSHEVSTHHNALPTGVFLAYDGLEIPFQY